MELELFSGLVARPNKQQDAIAEFKNAVMPNETTHSLEQILLSLTEQEMSSSQQKAKMIFLSSHQYSTSYLTQVKRMFPNLGNAKQKLLDELIQQISPRDILKEDEERPAIARYKALMAYHNQLEKSFRSMQPKQEKELLSNPRLYFKYLTDLAIIHQCRHGRRRSVYIHSMHIHGKFCKILWQF